MKQLFQSRDVPNSPLAKRAAFSAFGGHIAFHYRRSLLPVLSA